MTDNKIYKVKIKTKSGEYIGTFHSPFPDKRLSEALCRLDSYLNLKDVTQTDTGETYPFVVINKNTIDMIILLEEMDNLSREAE